MGKKNKKFKKVRTHVNTASTPQLQEEPEKIRETSVSAQTGAPRIAAQTSEIPVDPRYAIIRHEVKKVLLTIFALFVLLAVAYVVEVKTDTLDKAGDWMYKVANIQAQ